MLKRFAATTLLILVLAISLAVYLSTQKPSDDEFNLVLKYCVGAKNELNTFTETYTKDLIMLPPATTKLILTKQEKMRILQKIEEINFFSFPSTFPSNPDVWVTPQIDYYLFVQNCSQTKEISWNANSLIETDIENSLNLLVSYIKGLIDQKPEYKALPTPLGGYL